MIFPLKQRKLLRGAKEHIASGLGAACDWIANFENLVAPFDGIVSTYEGDQGGKWLVLTRANGDVIKFAHLESYVINKGNVHEGQVIAVTGNSGSVTSGPHLHCEVYINGNRVDPDPYFSIPVTYRITYINTWDDTSALEFCNSKIREFSSGKIQLQFDFRKFSVSAPPTKNLEQEAAVEAVRSVKLPFDTDGVMVFYEGTLARPWYATYSWPGLPTITHAQSPINAPGLLFEVKHQLILTYNKRRGSRPYIDNIDVYSGGEEIVRKQIEQLIPYLDAFASNSGPTKMSEQEVALLYQLLDIADEDGSGKHYWLDKPLAEFLKVVAQDKIEKLKVLL